MYTMAKNGLDNAGFDPKSVKEAMIALRSIFSNDSAGNVRVNWLN